jgi:hypothetical protein
MTDIANCTDWLCHYSIFLDHMVYMLHSQKFHLYQDYMFLLDKVSSQLFQPDNSTLRDTCLRKL